MLAWINVVPGARWAVTYLKLLDPCENHMMEVAMVETQDENGNPLSGVTVRFQAGDLTFDFASGGDKGPGKLEFAMTVPMNLSASVVRDNKGAATSDVATGLENYNVFTNMPNDYKICRANGREEEGNAPKHVSYRVVFRRLQ